MIAFIGIWLLVSRANGAYIPALAWVLYALYVWVVTVVALAKVGAKMKHDEEDE